MGLRDFLSNVDDRIHDAGRVFDDFIHHPSKENALKLWRDPLINPLYGTYNWILDELLPDPPTTDFSAQSVLVQRAGNRDYIPVIYGTRKVSGTRVYATVHGANNEFLTRVIVLCEGPVYQISAIYVDGSLSTDTKFTGYLSISTYTGDDNQLADEYLLENDESYLTTSRLRGLAYVRITTQVNRDLWGGGEGPEVHALVIGRQLYDVRTAATASSLQAGNPALCAYDFLTNARYGAAELPADLDIDSFKEAATYHERTIVDGVNEFSCDMVAPTGVTPDVILKRILAACRGSLIDSGGKRKLSIDRVRPYSYIFSPENMLAGISVNDGGSDKRYNRVQVTYVNPTIDWQNDVVVVPDAAALAKDLGIVREQVINLPHCTNITRAYAEGLFVLRKSRQQKTVKILATHNAWIVDPGDVVAVTYPNLGWDLKPFRVEQIEQDETLNLSFSLSEYDPYAFPELADEITQELPDTNLPNPFVVKFVQNVTLFSGDGTLIISPITGEIVSRLLVLWDKPADPYIDAYRVRAKRTDDGIWFFSHYINDPDQTRAYISPVEDGTEYTVEVTAINTLGRRSLGVLATAVVIGKLAPPPNVDSFLLALQGDRTRVFSWVINSPPADLSGVEIRYHASSQNWDDMIPLHDGLLYSSPWETNQLDAGTYNFAIKTVDTSGNRSVSVVYILNYQLPDPRLGAVIFSRDESAMYWPGIKTNCIRTNAGIIESKSQKTWATAGTWGTAGSWCASPYSSIAYELPEIDLGADVKFQFRFTANGSNTPSIQVQYRTSSGSYAGWVSVPSGPITARYFKAKVTVSQAAAEVPQLKTFVTRCDAEIMREVVNDLVMMSDARLTANHKVADPGKVRIPFTKNFSVITYVSVAIQGTGGGWTSKIIDKQITYGPLVEIYNSTPALANATIDAIIEGY